MSGDKAERQLTAAEKRLLLRPRDSADYYVREGLGSGSVCVFGAEVVTARRVEALGWLRKAEGYRGYEITDAGRAALPVKPQRGKRRAS